MQIALYLLIITVIFFEQSIFAQNVQFEFKRKPQTYSFQFTGLEKWDYQVTKEKQGFTLKIPKLSPKALEEMKKIKIDDLQILSINQFESSLTDTVTIQSSNRHKFDSFDYIIQNPSRLVIDFFVNLEANPKNQAVSPAIQKNSAEVKKTTERNPAQSDLLTVIDIEPYTPNKETEPVAADSSKQAGLFDPIDPNFERLSVPNSELHPDPELNFYLGDYIDYPFMDERLVSLDVMKKNMPTYVVSDEEPKSLRTKEKINAQLLVKLFNNKRYVVFFKTAIWFESKYPKSYYEEIIKSMWADAHYKLYLTDPLMYRNQLSLARARFEELIEKFPSSPLVARIMLFMGYSSIEDKDYIAAIRWFQRYISTYPDSSVVQEVRLAMVRSLIGASQFDEAQKLITLIRNEYCKHNSSCLVKSYLLESDIYILQKQWEKALAPFQIVDQKFKKEKTAEERFYYNYASVLFRKKDFKDSLKTYLEFIKNFPIDQYAGFALTRMGEIIDIISTNSNRSLGAYLEAYFRYGVGQGSTAHFAKIRLLEKQLPSLKGRSRDFAIKEISTLAKESGLPLASDYANFILAKSLLHQNDFDKALGYLIPTYQENPTHTLANRYLNLIQNTVSRRLVDEIDRNPLGGLKKHPLVARDWLINTKRLDLDFSIAKAYDQLGDFESAVKRYQKTYDQVNQLDNSNLEDRLTKAYQNPPTLSDIHYKMIASLINSGKWNDAFTQIEKADQKKYNLNNDQKKMRSIYLAQILNKKGMSDLSLRYVRDMRSVASINDIELLYNELKVLNEINEYQQIANYKSQIQSGCIQLKSEICYQMSRLVIEAERKILPNEKFFKSLQEFLNQYEEYTNLDDLRYELGKLALGTNKFKEAEQIWSKFKNPNSSWYLLAKSDLAGMKYDEEYTKHMNRIPAFRSQNE